MPTTKKWFPGHYIMASPDVVPAVANTADGRAWYHLSGDNGIHFEGIFQYVTWSRLEGPNPGQYNWTPIHQNLDILPEGKKFGVSLSMQSWNETLVPIPCPAYMVGNATYDQGYRIDAGSGTPGSTMHMASTMDRYLEMVSAFATEFDGDERLAWVLTFEIPYKVGWRNPYSTIYTGDLLRAQYYRMAQTFPALFTRTPAGAKGAWWSPSSSPAGAIADRDQFAQYLYDAGGGMGVPDCFAPEHTTGYNSNFRPHLLANAGLWPCWAGMEFADLLVGNNSNTAYQNNEYGSAPWPDRHTYAADLIKANFMFWNTNERQNTRPIDPVTGYGGRGFLGHLVPYLETNPGAGITTDIPTNMQSAVSGMSKVGKLGRVSRASIDKIGPVDDASIQRYARV